MGLKNYTIYSHSDADGGIAAGIFAEFIGEEYSQYGWEVVVEPINHISPTGEWYYREIKWPCSILDFSLHPAFLNDRFFLERLSLERKNKADPIPQCYWIDHHPTGSSFPFLTENNTHELMPHVITQWDTSAVSTPGLFRMHFAKLGLPQKLIDDYEDFIDLAEIIDGALFATCEAAHDFYSASVKLQTLFNPSHPAVDKNTLYKRLVLQITQNPSVEDLIDSDVLYQPIIRYEEGLFKKQLNSYKKITSLKGKVAFANFHAKSQTKSDFSGLGRFLPYLLFEEAEYALHILPDFGKGTCSVSCGINPWNKPKDSQKHLGQYFAKNFAGGGHAFVAGGKVSVAEFEKIEELVGYLNQT